MRLEFRSHVRVEDEDFEYYYESQCHKNGTGNTQIRKRKGERKIGTSNFYGIAFIPFCWC
jgi:hypothetical protein